VANQQVSEVLTLTMSKYELIRVLMISVSTLYTKITRRWHDFREPKRRNEDSPGSAYCHQNFYATNHGANANNIKSLAYLSLSLGFDVQRIFSGT